MQQERDGCRYVCFLVMPLLCSLISLFFFLSSASCSLSSLFLFSLFFSPPYIPILSCSHLLLKRFLIFLPLSILDFFLSSFRFLLSSPFYSLPFSSLFFFLSSLSFSNLLPSSFSLLSPFLTFSSLFFLLLLSHLPPLFLSRPSLLSSPTNYIQLYFIVWYLGVAVVLLNSVTSFFVEALDVASRTVEEKAVAGHVGKILTMSYHDAVERTRQQQQPSMGRTRSDECNQSTTDMPKIRFKNKRRTHMMTGNHLLGEMFHGDLQYPSHAEVSLLSSLFSLLSFFFFSRSLLPFTFSVFFPLFSVLAVEELGCDVDQEQIFYLLCSLSSLSFLLSFLSSLALFFLFSISCS